MKSTKNYSEIELDIIFNKTISLFRFIQGKDVFEMYYKHNLAKVFYIIVIFLTAAFIAWQVGFN